MLAFLPTQAQHLQLLGTFDVLETHLLQTLASTADPKLRLSAMRELRSTLNLKMRALGYFQTKQKASANPLPGAETHADAPGNGDAHDGPAGEPAEQPGLGPVPAPADEPAQAKPAPDPRAQLLAARPQHLMPVQWEYYVACFLENTAFNQHFLDDEDWEALQEAWQQLASCQPASQQ